MDLIKKRKADDNGGAYFVPTDLNNDTFSVQLSPSMSPVDAEKIIEPFTKEQILPILRAAMLRHPDVLEAVRAVADADPVQRKLFVRGLGWETTTEKLREVFSAYGEIDEGNSIVITDKSTGKSKGYGFVTFKHIDAAILALKDPNKKIDGRITVTQLASTGSSGYSQSVDVSMRKIYVGNIPFEINSERLLAHFAMFGEVEEGPLGFDKQNGKPKGFAFFVYKTVEGARASLVDPMKNIDGHQLVCKLATDNRKQKPNMGGMVSGMPNAGPMGFPGEGMPASNYGTGGYMGYGQGPNMPQLPQQTSVMHQNTGFNTAMGGQGYGGGSSQYSGVVNGAAQGELGGGLSNHGGYSMPPSTLGMQSSGSYPDSGNYGFQQAYPSHHNQPGSGPRFPSYHGAPPYY